VREEVLWWRKVGSASRGSSLQWEWMLADGSSRGDESRDIELSSHHYQKVRVWGS